MCLCVCRAVLVARVCLPTIRNVDSIFLEQVYPAGECAVVCV
jgi:hypothetical protein